MTTLLWTCPFCGRPVSLTSSSTAADNFYLDIPNADGLRAFTTNVKVCPNPRCNKFTLELFERTMAIINNHRHLGEIIRHGTLIPPSKAKPLPSYIPQPIVEDYTEACLIVELSPKASATLSRRCLQGMIRDFYKVVKPRLVDEIEGIRDKVDPITWQAIDAVRSIGNIGAHMEKDINLIVDVGPDEAEKLIGLIELLIEDWYVNKHKREEQLKSVLAVKAGKDAAKKGGSSSTPPPTTPTP